MTNILFGNVESIGRPHMYGSDIINCMWKCGKFIVGCLFPVLGHPYTYGSDIINACGNVKNP